MVTGAEAKPTVQTQILRGQLPIVLDLGMLSAIPVVQAIINDSWLYSTLGWLDPWYYLGYGLNYLDPTYLNDYYKVSRVPWILVEFVTRSSALPRRCQLDPADRHSRVGKRWSLPPVQPHSRTLRCLCRRRRLCCVSVRPCLRWCRLSKCPGGPAICADLVAGDTLRRYWGAQEAAVLRWSDRRPYPSFKCRLCKPNSSVGGALCLHLPG